MLDSEEFQRYAAYDATVELDQGALMTAPAERFDECFSRELVDSQEQLYRFTTVGRIVDERLKSRR